MALLVFVVFRVGEVAIDITLYYPQIGTLQQDS